ncbi:MAG TPA: class I SAM-dependent methyltransferase [Vicinamibacterales bacterium]|nr:class I SAM-dependent methyltransferase [Vicinamibacterales bacterium]
MSTTSNPQAEHYDDILDDYDRHYYDPYSLQYREQFILAPLLDGVDLRGKRVADLASGSGETTRFLMRRFPGVECTGFDVSPEAVRRYRAKTQRDAIEFDLTRAHYSGEPFDAAIIMGGLHHCAADIHGALKNVATMLRPGGSFLLFEPNREYLLEAGRRLWYRLDRYFDAGNERALSHGELLSAAAGAFDCRRVQYFGGPAFFLVYNSLVFRLSKGAKAAAAPALIGAERLYGRLPSKWFFSSFLAHWVRRDS